jgi:dUTP pyrophosphatase
MVNNLNINIQKIDNTAVIPTYSNNTDAGLDLTATSKKITELYVQYGTGLAIEIPEGYMGLIFPRSSISKINMSLANSVGVVDASYRGEILLRFRRNTLRDKDINNEYQVGDRVGQLIILPYPKIKLIEVDNLTDTDRGDGGFGSTGK